MWHQQFIIIYYELLVTLLSHYKIHKIIRIKLVMTDLQLLPKHNFPGTFIYVGIGSWVY